MLNAAWLETFATLCDVGHFTRAAAVLHMTQPGVSQHVKKLESQMGQALLTRDGKSFILTPAGEAVLAIARRRRAEERALQDALQHDDPDRGLVSIACSGSLALLLYPRLLALMAAAPDGLPYPLVFAAGLLCAGVPAETVTRRLEALTTVFRSTTAAGIATSDAELLKGLYA